MSANTDRIMNEAEITEFVKEIDKQPGLTVTLGQLVDAVGEPLAPGLPPNGPLMRTFAKRFPSGKGRLGALYQRLMRDVLQEVETFQPVRQAIIERYGKSTKEGLWTVEAGEIAEFQKEMNEARSAEIVLPHSLMPELRQFWECSPLEDGMLTWLVGEP